MQRLQSRFAAFQSRLVDVKKGRCRFANICMYMYVYTFIYLYRSLDIHSIRFNPICYIPTLGQPLWIRMTRSRRAHAMATSESLVILWFNQY